MKYILKKKVEKPFLYSKNNIVAEINNEFTNLTGYSNNELIGKSLTEISTMLKIDSQIYLENIENEYSCYMFTKKYEPIEVTISCESLNCENEKAYFIKENASSRVKEKFDFVKQLYTDSKTGFSIISVPDLILLKANENYLNYLGEPYNKMDNSIGKKHKEIIPGYEGNKAEEIWNSVITTGKPYYVEEFQHNYFKRGVTYWNSSIVPIFIEGKLKYIINKTLDVTERVLNRKLLHERVKIIEEQKEQLEAVIENVSDGVFISDKEGKYIKVNSKVRNIYSDDSLNCLGDSHKINNYFDMLGNEIAVENMPISRALNGEKVKNEKILVKSFSKEQIIEVNATPIFDANGNITMGAVFYNNITDLYNKEKIIKEQKKELEAIIENMSDGVFIVEKDNKVIQLNSRARDFLYYPNSLGKVGDTLSQAKYYNSEGHSILWKDFPIWRTLLKGERIQDFRFTCHRPDGIFHFSLSQSPIYDQNGNIEKVLACFRDITEQVNKDELIREEKQKFEAIIENMSDELVICDKNGQYTMLNKAYRNNYLFNVKELIKVEDAFKKVQHLDIDGNLISLENLPSARVAKGEKFSGYRVDIKNNKGIVHKEISGTPIYDNNGNFIAGVLVCLDISDRLKNEESLLIKRQYDLLSSIIENLDVGFVRYSYTNFEIIDMNKKAYIDLKQLNPKLESLSSVKGKNYFDIFYDDKKNKWNKVVQNLIEKKGKAYLDYRKLNIQGKKRFYKFMFQPVFGLNNQISEIIVISIDVTNEVKAKNKMEETLKVQDEIFSNISHELKTPLNVIFSTNQLMEFYLKNDSLEDNNKKVSNGINIIKQNCYRFTKLVNNIIDISKIEYGFLKLNLSNENIVSITENIVQSVSDYIKIRELNIIFDTNTEEKIIACDPDKIERIILNLISNAVKFTDASGSIFVNILYKGDTVEISVTDTGIGMDKKHLDNIFKRFHQVDKSLSRNAEGSGIGLSLVQSIVKLHGGKISTESKPDEGSIFKIELPARTIENPKVTTKSKSMNSKIEMINIEFSDIYSI